MFSIAHLFLRVEFFSAKLMLKTLYIVKEKFVLDKRKVYGHSFILDYLQTIRKSHFQATESLS